MYAARYYASICVYRYHMNRLLCQEGNKLLNAKGFLNILRPKLSGIWWLVNLQKKGTEKWIHQIHAAHVGNGCGNWIWLVNVAYFVLHLFHFSSHISFVTMTAPHCTRMAMLMEIHIISSTDATHNNLQHACPYKHWNKPLAQSRQQFCRWQLWKKLPVALLWSYHDASKTYLTESNWCLLSTSIVLNHKSNLTDEGSANMKLQACQVVQTILLSRR